MSIVKQVLAELLEKNSPLDGVHHDHDEKMVLNGWEIVKRYHSQLRNIERHSEAVIDVLIGIIIKRLHQIVQKITRSGEYLFYSKSLDRAAVCNVDMSTKQLRVVTVLPQGKQFALPGTTKVIVEGVQYQYVEID